MLNKGTDCIHNPRSFIVLYADNILLIVPSINEMQSLFRNCEKELRCLDMRINAKNHVFCALAQDLMLLVLVLLLGWPQSSVGE